MVEDLIDGKLTEYQQVYRQIVFSVSRSKYLYMHDHYGIHCSGLLQLRYQVHDIYD